MSATFCTHTTHTLEGLFKVHCARILLTLVYMSRSPSSGWQTSQKSQTSVAKQLEDNAPASQRVAHRHPHDWYKQAVFYEVLVQAFKDSNGDGIGDFQGLTEMLDYLQWLGVDCVWLPPVFDSPLLDGGYDVRDFTKILPDYGIVDDLQHLVAQAHQRGIRVIMDLVMNHTSDQHLWFEQSRRNPHGPYGDYYVWSDTPELYSDARIIFIDTEDSNWSYDPVRGQYYWHRFFSHQPDLNYENPAVQEEMLNTMRFWLDLGLDGFRLDAVPYLFEENGTNCENLAPTHEFLKRCRRLVDQEYPGRVLLAEANQWPHDVVEYFGDGPIGDECHMAFHFPLMPRLFMSLKEESAQSVIDILANTPAIPESGQWGIFLRNHDELTLEMVNDVERAFMYEHYAQNPRMRSNVGIRRRLASLLQGDLAQLQLLTNLLLSLPGSPVLYYGDEIGMGDNIWLHDRDGVRTPMQWSDQRNSGFSDTDPEQLPLPVITNCQFGHQAVNVESQLRNPGSLLHFTRNLIAVRKEHATFGMGSFRPVASSNPAIFAFIRQYRDETLLCVSNFAATPQHTELALEEFVGRTPVELLGNTAFHTITESWTLTLAPRGFYWMSLR